MNIQLLSIVSRSPGYQLTLSVDGESHVFAVKVDNVGVEGVSWDHDFDRFLMKHPNLIRPLGQILLSFHRAAQAVESASRS